jgi:xanthine dehydrogenase YagT iron-sulfur-binding subunit
MSAKTTSKSTNKKRSPSVKPSTPARKTGAVSRRGFIRGVGIAAGGASTAANLRAGDSAAGSPVVVGSGVSPVILTVNGQKRALKIEPRVTLLRALRNSLDLTGTKQICDRGSCGGCTVLVDGERVNSCMTLALDVVGKSIETVEGIAKGDELHPVQKAFCEFDALQCGFCTPGFVVASKNICDRAKATGVVPTRAQIQQDLSGNICRCGTYNRIFDAIEKVVGQKA